VVGLLELLVATGLMPYESWMKASTWGAYRAFADFIIGAIVCLFFMRSKLTVKSTLPAWATIIATVLGMHLGWSPYFLFAMIAFALFLAAVAERNAAQANSWMDAFAPIANVSFGIYLWHPVMEAIFISLMWRRFIEPTGLINFYVWLLVPMGMSVLVSLLSYRLIERPANNAILSWAGFRREKPLTAAQPAE
jgi:peptidoglycan/LPS O-acetylase OafA/YrhL